MQDTEQSNSFQKLLDFLDGLEHSKISFTLKRIRSETVMVDIRVPGERREVEFFADGHVEVEVFSRDRDTYMEGEEALARLFAVHSD